jgi:hypothetical protein
MNAKESTGLVPGGRETSEGPRMGWFNIGFEFSALRRNPTGWLIDGAFRYTLQFEEQRLDEDSGMAGLPGVSERDQ